MRGGVVVLLKPPGMSSHDVVGLARRRLRLPAGHLGTLDPLAAGVLVVAAGTALRVVRYAAPAEKQYAAQIWLGLSSPSDDLGTEAARTKGAQGITQEQIRDALRALQAERVQTPPSFSARQVGGERAYRAARRGETLDLPARPAELRAWSIAEYVPGDIGRLTLDITVSAGYYVRSLARDLGQKLGVGGLLALLVRLRSGRFRIAEAALLEEEWSVLPLQALLEDMPNISFEVPEARRLALGQRLAAPDAPDGIYAAFAAGRLFAVVRHAAGAWRPDTVIGLEDGSS